MEDPWSWATVVLLGFVSLFFIMKLFSYLQPKPNLPPSPMALLVIGHFHLIGYRVHRSFHKLSAILGPLFHVRLGSVPFIVASDAATARELLREHEQCFIDRKTAETISRLSYKGRSFVFAPYGNYWRFMKKLCVTEALGAGKLKELQWVRKAEVRRFLGLLYEKAERREEVDVRAALMRLRNNVIGEMTMGRRFWETDGEADQVMNIAEETMAVMGTPNVADFVGLCKNIDPQQLRRRAEKVKCRFDNLMERILAEEEAGRQENSAKTATAGAFRCLLQVLLDIEISEGRGEKRMTREDIKSLSHVTTGITPDLFSFPPGFHGPPCSPISHSNFLHFRFLPCRVSSWARQTRRPSQWNGPWRS